MADRSVTSDQMSPLVERLKAKYPHYKIISEPDPACTCKGAGERKMKPSRLWPEGHEFPCMCVCLSGDHRADCVKLVGEAAKRVAREEGFK